MKRIILIIGALLIGIVMQAQSVTYTCRYWFDKNQEQAVTATFSDSIWQAELDVGLLTEGLHTLYLHVMDTSMRWGAPQSFLFLKTSSTQPSDLSYHYWFDQNHEQMQSGTVGNGILLLDLDSLNVGLHTLHVMLKDNEYSASQSYLFLKTHPTGQGTTDFVYHCWFNQDIEHKQSNSLGSGNVLLDVADLEDGMHTINVMLEGDALTSTQSFLFMKVATFDLDTADMSHLVYHCWFDQDFENQQTDSLRDGHFLLDVDGLVDGLHTVNVMLEGGSGTLTTTQSFMFMKIAAQDPSVAMQYRCWFDQDYSTMQTGPIGAGVFELEVGDLKDGLHTVFVQMDNGAYATPQCYMFYKRPVGGYITKWEYWLNGDFDSRVTTNLVPRVDTLDIVTLLPVGHPALRSSCFHFHPNGETPYLNAKNELTLRVWNTEEYYKDLTAFFVDEQVRQDIVAQVFERNTTETFAAPRDNQIQWFKLDAGVGDSLVFIADKACTMQLFAPSGEEVYSATASEAMVFGGCHAWEEGTYYLAVHDMTGNGETLQVTYNWVYRYAVLAYDVQLVGNGGRSTITFQGNGFNSLLDVYLVNAQNDTIRPLNIGHESNSTTTVTFDFNGAALGYYKAVFHFTDEDLTKENCIKVEEATPFAFEVTASFASRFLRTTSNRYVFQVHNYSNMTAYEVPLAIHIYTPDAESLTRVEVDGFDVKSGVEKLLGSYYTDSIDYVIEQKKQTSGDLFGFLEDPNTEFVTDAPFLHHIFISPNLRPNTTETFTISVQSTNTVSVYMWCPEEWGDEDSTRNLSKAPPINPIIQGFCAIVTSRHRYCWLNSFYYENGGIGDPPYIVDCENLPTPPGICPHFPGGPSTPVNSIDPNDIHGYLSESGSHYMRQEIQNVQYEIEFENDTTLATAAAHTIIVRDTLDATKFDLNSLAARSVTIGDKRLELNGEQIFAHTLDLRPEIYVIAQVEQDYDPATGIIQWTIQSLDPMTMEPTDDPNQGVLPVNYYGNGVGFIDYSIDIKDAFADGTTISNRAGIIFDQNDVIMTPTWTNIIDAVKPVSHIEEVVLNADTLNFIFASEDNRSGVWYHTLYHRNASTEMEWKVKKAQIFENNYLLVNDELMTTEFLVMATDSAGNREEKEMLAEYIFVYDGPGQITQADALAQGWNWWSTYIEQNDQDGLVELESSLGHNGLTIKSQNDFTDNFYQDMGVDYWYGSLESIQNEQGYLINVAQQCNTSITGVAANAANHPITIHPNWNWIGYPVASPQAVTSALAGFTPSPDDVVKGQSDFTSYFEGYGWYPEDFMLIPGQSYLYCSNANANKTLNYTGGSRGGAVKMTKAEKRYWNNNVHAFADNFNVIAVVKVDNVEQRGENLELGAFVDGECRGSARLRYFAPLDRYYAMLTITGQEDDKVEFRLIDSENLDREEIGLNQLVFKKNTVVGRLGKPYEIYFGDNDMISDNMVMYPNPVERGHEFSLDIPHDETIIEIVITDVLGTQVRHEAGAVNAKSVKGLLAAGVYVIKAVAKSGTTYHGRLIVE